MTTGCLRRKINYRVRYFIYELASGGPPLGSELALVRLLRHSDLLSLGQKVGPNSQHTLADQRALEAPRYVGLSSFQHHYFHFSSHSDVSLSQNQYVRIVHNTAV